MASKASTQPLSINTSAQNNETGFDFALSPSEPGKFDFYRVHVNSQVSKNDSMFADHHDAPDASQGMPKRWLPFDHMKHLSEQPKTASSSELYSKSTAASEKLPMSNKPIQTVASFSSLTDAVKNAMYRGTLGAPAAQLRRPGSGNTLSSKELNHLSPQSM